MSPFYLQTLKNQLFFQSFIIYIYFALFSEPEVVRPCEPSPCGPNSRCQTINSQAVCSCVPGFLGQPPTCRPECSINSDCPLNQACINQKCADPCTGSCGVSARCQVVNHNPICSCPSVFTGDPFTRCFPIRKHRQDKKSFFRKFH